MSAVTPKVGPRFRAVIALRIAGEKRKRVAAMLGALADGGQETTTSLELEQRLGWDPRKVGALLARLEADGYVARSRRTARRRLPRYRVAPEHLAAELRPQEPPTPRSGPGHADGGLSGSAAVAVRAGYAAPAPSVER